MELLRRTLAQFRELYQGMSPSQRGTLIAVPLLVLAGLGILMYSNNSRSEEYLLGGKIFDADELLRAQDAFRAAGLTEARPDGAKISVPRRDVERYTAALVVNRTLPSHFSADFDKLNNKITLFTSESQRKEMVEEARKLRLARILRAIPDIEDAAVEWDRLKPTGLSRQPTIVTAQVSVLARGGRELSPQLIHSLRLFVAGAVAGVATDNVNVLDMNTGRVYAPPKGEDAAFDRYMTLSKQRSDEYEAKIRQQLANIPDVIVTVNVDLDNLRSSIERQQVVEPKPVTLQSRTENKTQASSQKQGRREGGVMPNTPRSVPAPAQNDRSDTTEETVESNTFAPSFRNIEKVFEGLLPKSVQVAVSIPEDFYHSVAIQRGIAEGTTDEDKKKFQAAVDAIRIATEKDVSRQVQKLIPNGSGADAITVTSYVHLDHKKTPRGTPWMGILSDLVNQWGGAIALALFALWALRILNKSVSKAMPAPVVLPPPVDELETAAEPVPQSNRRDDLQVLVRDNPELAASLLGRWISPVN